MQKRLVAAFGSLVVLFAVLVQPLGIDAGSPDSQSDDAVHFDKAKRTSGYSWEENETETENEINLQHVIPTVPSVLTIQPEASFSRSACIPTDRIHILHSLQQRPLWLIHRVLIL